MDRLPRQWIAACGLGLGLVTIVSGCRSTRPEVPPGRPFAGDGRQRPAIQFGSEGHPMNGAAITNIMPDTANGGSKLAQGIAAGARPDGSTFSGVPGAYGPPGSAGGVGDPGLGRPPKLDTPPVEDPATTPASTPPVADPGGVPPTMPPPSDNPPVPEPIASPAPTPNPIIQEAPTPGRMGSSGQMPGPV